jgi:hypothetical protein
LLTPPDIDLRFMDNLKLLTTSCTIIALVLESFSIGWSF